MLVVEDNVGRYIVHCEVMDGDMWKNREMMVSRLVITCYWLSIN